MNTRTHQTLPIDPQRRSRLAAMPGYVLVDRNIHLCAGKYRVLITRRPKNIYGGRFRLLADAKRARDVLEAQYRRLTPWENTPRVKVRRTQTTLRMERRAAGLCQSCGTEPPKAGCVTCQGCMDAMHAKRNLRRDEAHNAEVSDGGHK